MQWFTFPLKFSSFLVEQWKFSFLLFLVKKFQTYSKVESIINKPLYTLHLIHQLLALGLAFSKWFPMIVLEDRRDSLIFGGYVDDGTWLENQISVHILPPPSLALHCRPVASYLIPHLSNGAVIMYILGGYARYIISPCLEVAPVILQFREPARGTLSITDSRQFWSMWKIFIVERFGMA